ncbi:unnamed protein product [Chrysoparadoxa australica]
MKLRKGSVSPERITGSETRIEIQFERAGGLTHLGANVVILQPGERSSECHYHANSDEFHLLLKGAATVVENDGGHELSPDDRACWPAGVENARTVENRTDAPIEFLAAGTNPLKDQVRYPDAARTLYHEPPEWRQIADDGTVLKHGKTED